MPRATPLQSALNAGELSPRMEARTDFAKYPLGCATLENMVPLPQGGAARRPGTMFVADVKVAADKARLLPFEFSTEQAYIIEAGAGYFRFYRDHGQIVVPETDAAISNGTFETGISGWDDRSTGAATIAHEPAASALALVGASSSTAWAEQAVATGAVAQEHVIRCRVVGAAGDEIALRIGSASTADDIAKDVLLSSGFHAVSFTPTSSPFYIQFRNAANKTITVDDVEIIPGAAVEVGTPYAAQDLAGLKFAQSADVLYICHREHPVHKLIRRGHTSWSMIAVAFNDGPYLLENTDNAKTFQPSATSGNGITVTAAGHAPFAASDVGRLVRIKHGSTWGHAVITGFTSATSVTADVKTSFGATTAQPAWRLGAWSGTTGYPIAVAFFEQRLGFAGTREQPQTFWLSQSADFENMEPDSVPDGGGERQVEDDDALNYTISADQVNAIRWMSPGRQLVIGTVGGEWLVQSDGPLLTPTDIDVKRQTAFGSADIAPVIMRGRLLFLQRAARKILEFTFSLELDNFQALDQTLLADHVARGGIVDLAYQQELDSTLWCVRADGQMPTLTFQPDQEVIGWARQIVGGSFDGGQAQAESVAVIPGDAQDEIWLICKRTINGQTRRYVEFIAPPHEPGDDQAAARYVDSALASGELPEPATVFSGLEHLEGETVSVLADGAVHPPRTVEGGSIVLDYPASKVVAGLPYAHRYRSLKWEAGAATGTAQGLTKRIHGVTLVLLESSGVSIGPDFDHLKSVPFRTIDKPMDSAVPLFTGERFVEFDGDFATDTRIALTGDDPLPFTLLAIAPVVKTNG